MPLPPLTHLQFTVLGCLIAKDRNGRDVRGHLAEHDACKTTPGFYQLMARMEEAKLIKGRYERAEAGGHSVRQRWYTITAGGRAAWDQTRMFYIEQSRGALENIGGVSLA